MRFRSRFRFREPAREGVAHQSPEENHVCVIVHVGGEADLAHEAQHNLVDLAYEHDIQARRPTYKHDI